jgi:hypothetical protein
MLPASPPPAKLRIVVAVCARRIATVSSTSIGAATVTLLLRDVTVDATFPQYEYRYSIRAMSLYQTAPVSARPMPP